MHYEESVLCQPCTSGEMDHHRTTADQSLVSGGEFYLQQLHGFAVVGVLIKSVCSGQSAYIVLVELYSLR